MGDSDIDRLPEIGVSGLCERDVDLLLLEEFASSPKFARWFLSQAGIDIIGDIRVESAMRSVTTSRGESDLEVFVSHGGGITCLLVENKIHAVFQPRQAERYRERGATHLEGGQCTEFSTILVAPSAYVGSKKDDLKGFDSVVTYEDVSTWLGQAEPRSMRRRYKRVILERAITKATLGYHPEDDAEVTEFWRLYWELVQREVPELEMEEPGAKPSRAGFVYFRPGGMPTDVCIVHKLARGHVDLQFSGMADNLEEIRHRYASWLESGMSIKRAGKSGVIRVKVPAVYPGEEMASQLDDVRTGLQQATRLLRWFRESQEPSGT